jgi:hypothetical protein
MANDLTDTKIVELTTAISELVSALELITPGIEQIAITFGYGLKQSASPEMAEVNTALEDVRERAVERVAKRTGEVASDVVKRLGLNNFVVPVLPIEENFAIDPQTAQAVAEAAKDAVEGVAGKAKDTLKGLFGK